MDIKILEAGDNNYLWQVVENNTQDLPDNVMLNKVITGCGGTSVALMNSKPYVICVPYRNLIVNKMKWAAEHNVNVCAVMGGTLDGEILSFTGNKYIVTYDSLERLCSFIDCSKFKILIDESHKLIDSGAFRGDAVRTVLRNFRRFNSFVFMTATPVKDNYQLPELREIQKCTVKWNNITPVSVRYMCMQKGTNISQNVAVIAVKHLKNEIEGNAHIFINSVTAIIDVVKILKKSGLFTTEEISIVCANNEENQDKINKELGKGYDICEVGDVSKINFYTSTCFEGCDISDITGKSYIVSDGKKDYSKIDILTTLPQIIARIRDSVYRYNVTLLFTPNQYYSHTTEEEFEVTVKRNLAEADGYVTAYRNTTNSQVKLALYTEAKTNAYIIQQGDNLIVNETAWYNEMHSFETLHRTYYVSTGANLEGSSFIHNETTYNYSVNEDNYDVDAVNKMRLGKKSDFTKLCQEYCESKDAFSAAKMDIENEFPIIKEAYNVLGAVKCKALKYRKADIERELVIADSVKANAWKIVKLLDFKVGNWISLADLKMNLQEVYAELGIVKTAKSTDISEWYEVASSKKRIDGVQVAGVKIITCNINLK